MRSGVDGTTLALYTGQRFDSHTRIKVANGSGTLVNLSQTTTQTSRYKSYRLELPNPNLPIGALTVDFVRETTPALSLAPFVTASTFNRLDDGTTFSSLLQLGRVVTMEVALTAEGAARPADGASTWYEVFRGNIISVRWPQTYGRTATIVCTDAAGLLQKSKSTSSYTYTAGTAIETVVQQILTNNGHTSLTLSCPVATGKVLPNDVAPGVQKTVWEQIAQVVNQMGWLVFLRYSGTTTLALTMFEPPRGKTVPDQTLSVYNDFSDFGIDETQLGNDLYVRFYDENGIQQEVHDDDPASIARYGGFPRSMWIVLEPTSPVRSSTDATALLNAALADVADPDVLATVSLPPLWFAENAVDLYTFPVGDGRLFDVAQDAAPFAVTISETGTTRPVASAQLRGKPSAGAKSWAIVGGGEIVTESTSSLVLADVIDSFQLGDYVPYVSAGGATDAWPRRPFTVNTDAYLGEWSLGGLFKQDVGNVTTYGPQGLENYMRFQNTNSISGPNLGIISNAEMAGPGGTVVGMKLFTGGFVMNANAATVSGNVTTYDAGGVSRVSGADGVFSGKVIGFRGNIPATHAAVTGESWNTYNEGTAPNYFAGRVYFGSTTETTYLERLSANLLGTGGAFSAASFVRAGSTWLTSGGVLQNVTADAGILTGTVLDARLSSNVPLKSATNVFTGTAQEIHPAASGSILRFASDAVAAGTGYSHEIRFYDGASTGALAGRFMMALTAGSSANRAMQFTGGTDRDGGRLKLSFITANAAGTSVAAMEILAGSDVGKVNLLGPASAGTETEGLLLDHRVTAATGTGYRMAFRSGTTGATTMAEFAALHTSSTSADLVWRTRLSGSVGERLRLTSGGSLLLNGAGDGGGSGMISVANASVAPASYPSLATLMYAGTVGGAQAMKFGGLVDSLGFVTTGGALVATYGVALAATGQQLLPLANYAIELRSGLSSTGFISVSNNSGTLKGSFGWDASGIGIWNAAGVRQVSVLGTVTTIAGTLSIGGGITDSQGAAIVGHLWGTSGPPAGTYTTGTVYFQHDT